MALVSRVLTPEKDLPLLAYLGALILYVILGLVFKTVFLNWIVGPLFLFATLYLVPSIFRQATKRKRSAK